MTYATIDYSDYFEVIRRTNNPVCIGHIVSAISAIDKALDTPFVSRPLKALFGLEALEHDDDFASVLQAPLGAVQATNWDSTQSSSTWDHFCETIGAGGADMQIGVIRVPAEVVNYARWIRAEVVAQCPKGWSVEEVGVRTPTCGPH